MKILRLAPLALPVLGVASVSTGATHRVPSEYATINDALGVSVYGDTVVVAPGTYTDWETRPGPGDGISAAVFLVDGVVVRSEAGSSVTAIDMQHEGIGFVQVVLGVDLPSADTRLEGFTIRGVLQNAPAILIANSGKLTVVDCRVEDVGVQAPGTGPSALRSRYTDVEVIDCTFENCSAGVGGAIGQLAGSAVIENCEFLACSNNAVFLDGQTGDSPSAFIADSRFIGNTSDEGSAALFISNFIGGVEVLDCRFENNVSDGTSGAGAVSIGTGSQSITVSGCVFLGNALTGNGSGGGLFVTIPSGSVEISGNTFYGNEVENPFVGSAVDVSGPFQLAFSNNIVASSSPGPAVSVIQGVMINTTCNVFWDNPGGNSVGFSLSPTDRIVNPEFCDPDSGDLTLSPLSPCLPPNSLGCGLIGALGEGCGTVSIAPESWSVIKSKYR